MGLCVYPLCGAANVVLHAGFSLPAELALKVL
jgi:hypothetical protein